MRIHLIWLCVLAISWSAASFAQSPNANLDEAGRKGVFNDIANIREELSLIATKIATKNDDRDVLGQLSAINSGVIPGCKDTGPNCTTELHKKLGEIASILTAINTSIRKEQLEWISIPKIECTPSHPGDCQLRSDIFCQKLQLNRAAHFRLASETGEIREIIDLACVE